MTRLRHLALTAALLTALSPIAANAGARLGLGADFWVDHGGVFELTLGVDTPLVRNVHLGARFGGLISTTAPEFGVPLDLDLRVNFGRIYLEGLVGPWIFFDSPTPSAPTPRSASESTPRR